MMPATFSQRLSRPSRQARQWPQVSRAVHHDLLPGEEARHALAHGGDLAGGLDAGDLRHLALGEGHAAKTPDVEIVQGERLDAHLDFARCGRRRGFELGDAKVAVAEKLQGAHEHVRGRRHARFEPGYPDRGGA